jgi:hypothetical protein
MKLQDLVVRLALALYSFFFFFLKKSRFQFWVGFQNRFHKKKSDPVLICFNKPEP